MSGSSLQGEGGSMTEALIASALFVIAGLGAWLLYKEQIRYTARSMMELVLGTEQRAGGE